MKTIIKFTLLLALLIPVTASAHDFEVNGIYYYRIYGSNNAIVTYRGTSYNDYYNEYSDSVIIPETVTYNGTTYSVTSIGYDAFRGCSGLTSVTIPNSVTSIRERAFEGCSGLTSVTIGNSVTSIGYDAFRGCSGLTSVNIPNSVTSIGKSAFYYCSGLTSVTIGNSVTSIGDYAFMGCSGLTSVNIPNSVTSIGDCAFDGCSGLASVTIPNSVTSIGKSAFYGCSGLTSVTIPNSVTSIGNSAFNGCSGLASVTIPNSVTSIGNSAFYGCRGLTSVTIPNSITSIGDYAFQECFALKTINFNADSCADFSSTGSYSPFYNLNITTVNIGNSVQRIPAYFASGLTELASVTIGNSVTSIGNYAFNGCSGLTSVTIPSSVTSIGSSAFQGTAWYDNQPNGLVYAGQVAYHYKGTMQEGTNIVLRDGTKGIAGSAFNGCSGLTSVTIPNSVTSIGDYAFQGCSGLTNVTIPNSVTSIGDCAFYGCSGLTSVTIGNSVTSIGNYAFQECFALETINFNADSCADFSSTGSSYRPFYNLNITTINFGNSVHRIPAYFASGLTKLASVTIGNSVTSIGNSAFYNCSGLTNVIIPNSVTSIGDYAFQGCSGLTNVTIPNSVTSIGNSAFSDCSCLNSINIGNSVNLIGYSAFYNCSNLTKVTISDLAAWCNISFGNYSANPLLHAHHLYLNGTEVTNLTIPNTISSIRIYAFYGCSGLTNVTIPNSVTSIGDCAFYGCSGLTSVTIPNSVTSIGDYAFQGCSGLTNVTIPNSVTSIGKSAFYGCRGLTSVTIPNSVTSIDNNAFKGCSALNTLDFNAKSCADFSSTASLHPFYNLNISSINIGDSVQRIPAYFAYGLRKLSNITISNSVTSIGGYAFYGCSELSGTIKIPKNITYIGDQAFNNDPSIETVICAAETPPTWNDIAMFTTNVYNHSPLYVPTGSIRAYQADQCWGQFSTIIGIGMQDAVLATAISLSQSQMSLIVGNLSQLTATVLPDSTTNKAVNWISSNPDIATVNANGLVTAIAPGSATITAITTDGTNLTASCVVTVTENLSDYDNFLSMDDVEAFHGDTIVIPVKMTNETSIISFQTDIFLPEGLEVLQEDGEYLIDPSERMTRTHTIMSNNVSNGSIRVICYSSNYKPFTGNSGDDLFYITVKVADNAEGDYTIQLKNTLLTNTDFVDLAAPDVAANVNVKAYLLGDANNSGTVSITDVVVTAQHVLELNPQPFVFEAADVNVDGNITVADVSRIAWMVLNPAQNAPLRAPALWNNGDRMSAEDITLATGETRRVSILLDNEIDYNAFQLDLNLPEGLTASNFQLTDRAGSHAFDVNTLLNGNIRALCYSPALTVINGHEGALLTFDVTAAGDVNGDILVDGIELVTADCQSVKLDAFTIGINKASRVNELATDKTIAKVEYFNLAGQRIELPSTGVTLIVTTYTDGTQTTSKVIK